MEYGRNRVSRFSVFMDDSPMRILHIVQSLDPAGGGIARVVPDLAAELARAGEQCRIATLVGGRFGNPPEVPGVEVLKFPPNGTGSLGRSREFNSRITDLIREADVVHLHGLWSGQNWAAGAAARQLRRPCVISPRGMMMPWAWNRGWWKKRPFGWLFEHRNLRQAARLHVVSESEAAAVRALGFNDRITCISSGLHVADYANLPPADEVLARWPELQGRKCLLFMGRIHPQKGIIQAMQACFDVLAAGSDWHLIIAGPDEIGLRAMLEAAITRKGLSNRVTFTGLLTRREVQAVLGGVRLLLQPSQGESLSMSILEALAAGVPVAISAACHMPEVETRDAGRIVEPTRGGIARVLRKLLTQDDQALQAMGRRGREMVAERFDWSRLLPQYQQMYREVANSTPS